MMAATQPSSLQSTSFLKSFGKSTLKSLFSNYPMSDLLTSIPEFGKRIKRLRHWSLTRTKATTDYNDYNSKSQSPSPNTSILEPQRITSGSLTPPGALMIFERSVQLGPSLVPSTNASPPEKIRGHSLPTQTVMVSPTSLSIPSHYTTESYTAPILDATCELITGNDADLDQIKLVAVRRPSSILSSSGLTSPLLSRSRVSNSDYAFELDQDAKDRRISFFSYAEFLEIDGLDTEAALQKPVLDDDENSQEEEFLSIVTVNEMLRVKTGELKREM
ncbi:unnamed protein product [Kuraishia capsulata CBS 1993]|uniref:Uncharacterized protein n=1 Tax=Kuraishia capsulata CBS 1993 TaxID=1382522 RepID=W6MG58_9ASCO|nr:uncharacterized protein KUCA_T00000400001 [Kuraishia capsulata CBS 1993]CDK24438.1 unnamed protein product [Kuraishia capsulata CBS 1993]